MPSRWLLPSATCGWCASPRSRRHCCPTCSYSQELAFYGPSDRLALRFPSPFLRNEPTALVLEGTEDGANWQKTLTVSYQESFKRELEHFYECVVDGKVPYTTGQEARQDIV